MMSLTGLGFECLQKGVKVSGFGALGSQGYSGFGVLGYLELGVLDGGWAPLVIAQMKLHIL